MADKKAQLKELMRMGQMKKQNDSKHLKQERINSPLARYNNIGQLICIICNEVLKAEALWVPHCAGKVHKEILERLKQKNKEKQLSAQPISEKREQQLSATEINNSGSDGNETIDSIGLVEDYDKEEGKSLTKQEKLQLFKRIEEEEKTIYSTETMDTKSTIESSRKEGNSGCPQYQSEQVQEKRGIPQIQQIIQRAPTVSKSTVEDKPLPDNKKRSNDFPLSKLPSNFFDKTPTPIPKEDSKSISPSPSSTDSTQEFSKRQKIENISISSGDQNNAITNENTQELGQISTFEDAVHGREKVEEDESEEINLEYEKVMEEQRRKLEMIRNNKMRLKELRGKEAQEVKEKKKKMSEILPVQEEYTTSDQEDEFLFNWRLKGAVL